MVWAIWVAFSGLLGESRVIDVMPTFSHPTAFHSACRRLSRSRYFNACMSEHIQYKKMVLPNICHARRLGSYDEWRLPLRIPSSSTAPFRSCYAGLKTLLFVIIRDRIPPGPCLEFFRGCRTKNPGTVCLTRVNMQILH
jgi:hypothetical protein